MALASGRAGVARLAHLPGLFRLDAYFQQRRLRGILVTTTSEEPNALIWRRSRPRR